MRTARSAWTGAPSHRTARIVLFFAVAIGMPVTVWQSRGGSASIEQFAPLIFLGTCALVFSIKAITLLEALERDYPEADPVRQFVGSVAVLLPVIALLTAGGVIAAMR